MKSYSQNIVMYLQNFCMQWHVQLVTLYTQNTVQNLVPACVLTLYTMVGSSNYLVHTRSKLCHITCKENIVQRHPVMIHLNPSSYTGGYY